MKAAEKDSKKDAPKESPKEQAKALEQEPKAGEGPADDRKGEEARVDMKPGKAARGAESKPGKPDEPVKAVEPKDEEKDVPAGSGSKEATENRSTEKFAEIGCQQGSLSSNPVASLHPTAASGQKLRKMGIMCKLFHVEHIVTPNRCVRRCHDEIPKMELLRPESGSRINRSDVKIPTLNAKGAFRVGHPAIVE